MLIRKMTLIAAVLLALSFLQPSSAAAQQDCGAECHRCGFGEGWEGRVESGNDYDMNCEPMVNYCVACAPALAGEPDDVERLAELIRSAAPGDLAGIAAKHGHRLLVNPSRNLVVLQGNRCDPTALVSVVFVSRDKATVLERLGIRKLEEHLSQAPIPAK